MKSESLQSSPDYIKYSFLPNNIKIFKLNKDEVKLLKLRKLQEELETKSILEFYLNQFFDEKAIIEAKQSLTKKVQLIPIEILTNIIIKYNLNTFYIQELQPEDILEILRNVVVKYGKKRISLFELFNLYQTHKIYATQKNECMVLEPVFNNELYEENETLNDFKTLVEYFFTTKNDSLKLTKKITCNTQDSQYEYKDDNWDSKHYFPYFDLNTEYFMTYYKEDDLEKEIYDENYKNWKESMDKFTTLKEAYKYFKDTLKLKKTTPNKYRLVMATKKGETLLEFFNKYNNNSKTVDSYIPSRIALQPYLGTEINICGCLAEIQEDRLLFKDIYKGEEFIAEHMWQYGDIVKEYSNLITGKYYELKGKVKSYKKELSKYSKENGEIIKVTDYHVDITEIK